VPEINPHGYGVYNFRKGFEMTSIPETFPVHVSADIVTSYSSMKIGIDGTSPRGCVTLEF